MPLKSEGTRTPFWINANVRYRLRTPVKIPCSNRTLSRAVKHCFFLTTAWSSLCIQHNSVVKSSRLFTEVFQRRFPQPEKIIWPQYNLSDIFQASLHYLGIFFSFCWRRYKNTIFYAAHGVLSFCCLQSLYVSFEFVLPYPSWSLRFKTVSEQSNSSW